MVIFCLFASLGAYIWKVFGIGASLSSSASGHEAASMKPGPGPCLAGRGAHRTYNLSYGKVMELVETCLLQLLTSLAASVPSWFYLLVAFLNFS